MHLLMRDVLEFLVLGFVFVGTPALILKLMAIWFVRSDAAKPRLRLLALSIGGAALAGAVTIVCYAILSRLLEFPAPGTQYVPKPIVFVAAVAILVGLVAAADFLFWRHFLRSNNPQPQRMKAVWLVAGNAWILWAIWLMDQYREIQLLSGVD
jgi:Co/Zn/Cd efflux system component